MRVAFSVGKNSGLLIDNIKKHHDDIEFFTYNNVKDLIKESTLRHIYFDRIIYTERLLRRPEEDLNMLNNYIIENSDSTTVVLIVEKADSEASLCFEKIFNSPLYTRAVLQKATSLILCEIVTGGILEIREKYFNSVVGSQRQGNQSGGSERVGNPGVDTRNSGNREQQAISGNVQNSTRSISIGYESGSAGTVGQNSHSMYGEYESRYKNSNGSDFEGEGFSGFSNSVPGSVGSSDNFDEKSNFSEEDDFLGLGSYGESHSDTGFLDEDDFEEEGTQNDENLSGRSSSSGDAGKSFGDNSEREEGLVLNVSEMSKVILVTGERGTGVTTTIADIAYDLYHKGESVLIVDADYQRNGILSFIDSVDFYSKGNEDGIDTINPYIEEEADIISNGYGSQLSKTAISNVVFNHDIQNNYDRIIIDCPLDCLNVITERVVRGNTVLVLTKGDRGALVSTSIGLTDRLLVEISLERYIMETCVVGVSGYSSEFDEDIKFVKETFLFPNGCWLDNIV